MVCIDKCGCSMKDLFINRYKKEKFRYFQPYVVQVYGGNGCVTPGISVFTK
jgi:hypothetical protein